MAQQVKNVVLIGGGTSIREEWLNNGLFDNIKDCEIWALNFAYRTMPYAPSRVLWVDKNMYTKCLEDFKGLHQQGTVLCTKTHGLNIPHPRMSTEERKFVQEVIRYGAARNKKHAEKRKCLYYGRHGLVGTFALAVALYEQYDNIYLLGHDYGTKTYDDTDTHYYGPFIKVESEGIGRPSVYYEQKNKLNDFLKDYEYFNSNRHKIINVINTRYPSHINVFPKIDYKEFYKRVCT